MNIAWPYIYTESEQDACSFGPVSNEKYLAFLADVKHRAQTYWAPLPDGAHPWPVDDDMPTSMTYRLNDATKDLTDFYERLAMSHAVMRYSGMRLREKQGSLDWVKTVTYEEGETPKALRYEYAHTAPIYTIVPLRMFRFDSAANFTFSVAPSEAVAEPAEPEVQVPVETEEKPLKLTMESSKEVLRRAAAALIKDAQISFEYHKQTLIGSDPDDASQYTFYPILTDYETEYNPCPTVPGEGWVKAYMSTF